MRTDQNKRTSIRKRFAEQAGCALVFLLKVIAVGSHEIAAEPNDALGYMQQVLNLGQNWGLGSTGYTTWLWVVQKVGMPQRLAIEFFWAIASLCFATVVARFVSRRGATVPVFAVLMFAPPTFYLFDRAMTDGFYLCLSILMLSAAINILREPVERNRWQGSFALGVVVSVMMITRNETAIIVPFIGACGLILFAREMLFSRATAWAALKSLTRFAVILVVVGSFLSLMMMGYNRGRYGVMTKNFVEMPSHMRLLKTLASIETGEKNLRFVPVSKKAREIAYAYSPTLQRFRDAVESPQSSYQQASMLMIGVPGEIGAGWIWHVFNAAAPEIGLTRLVDLDRTYRQAIKEIEAGLETNHAARRFVPHPFLGGQMSVWLPFVWNGMRHAVDCLMSPPSPMADGTLARDAFDQVCLRRSSLVPHFTLQIQGWAFSPDPQRPITSIELMDEKLNVLLTTRCNVERPDVRFGFAKLGIDAAMQCGFSFQTEWPEVSVTAASLSFRSGGEEVASVRNIGPGRQPDIRPKFGPETFHFGLDVARVDPPPERSVLGYEMKTKFLSIQASPIAWVTGIILGGMALMRLLFISKHRIEARAWLLIAAIAFSWAILRVLFYALISAGAWMAEPRYLQNSSVVFLLTATVLIVGALASFKPKTEAAEIGVGPQESSI